LEGKKIKMGDTLAAGPLGIVHPNKEQIVSKELAETLVGGKAAKYVRVVSPEKAVTAPKEKAVTIESKKDVKVNKPTSGKRRSSKKAVK